MAMWNLFFLTCIYAWMLGQTSGVVVEMPRAWQRQLHDPVPVEWNEQQGPKLDVFLQAVQKRQVFNNDSGTPTNFSTTVPLTGDKHNFGLVHWSGLPKQRIFILTRQRGAGRFSTESWLWISKNYGKNFTNVTNLFPDSAVLEWYYISSNADILVFTDRINRMLYVTTDEGDSFTGYSVQFVPSSLRFQSSFVSNVTKYERHVLAFDRDAKSLWVSSDVNSSSSWTMLGSNVTRYYWRQLNSTYESPTTVYFDKAVTATTAMLYYANQSQYSNPRLFNSSLGQFLISSFVLQREYLFVQKSSATQSSEYASPLWVSHWRKPFMQAQFPLELQEKHYSVVDATEGQVFIGVYHDPNNTNLYLSEAAGIKYSLSLQQIISPPEYDWVNGYPTFDVYVVEGISATYLVNKRVAYTNNGYTVISFDKGGQWTPLTPPAVDANQQPLTCNPPCALHLHMYIDAARRFLQPVLSQDSAPGVIMALGNTGTSLTYGTADLKLYVSANGGVSWRELFSSYNEFQLLDFGVYTVVTPKYRKTSTVYYSCDEGATWNQFVFSKQPIWVVRMLTEFGEKAQHATIFGYMGYPDPFEWLIIDLDFETLQLDQCNDTEDYYQWSPTDERPSQQCILGEQYVFERRLPDHCCFIHYGYDRPINQHSCPCTNEDYECDFGFQREDLNGPCNPVSSLVYPPAPPTSCYVGGNYSFTSGYRKIAGDSCFAANETFFLPKVRPCPVVAPGALFIDPSIKIGGVGQAVSFTLQQVIGAVNVTSYQWDYGDNTTSVLLHGLASAKHSTHIYWYPGRYEVRMTASNSGGQGVASTLIEILDSIQSVSIKLSPLTVPVGQTVILQAIVTTVNNTQEFTPATYQWDFGDGSQPVSSNTLFVSHVFTSEIQASVTVVVSNSLGAKTGMLSILAIDVSSNAVKLVALATDNHPASPNNYVPIITPLSIQLQSINSSQALSVKGLQYLWSISGGVIGYKQFAISNSSTLSITLSVPGSYTVFVHIYFGPSFFSSRYLILTAIDSIQSVSIVSPHTVAIGQVVYLYANVTTLNNTQFYTPAQYHWDFGDGSPHVIASTPSVPHVFSSTRSLANVSVVVSNGLGGQANSYISITAINVTNDNLVLHYVIDGAQYNTAYLPTLTNITFSVDIVNSNKHFEGFVYSWNIHQITGTVPPVQRVTNTSSLTNIVFTNTGSYVVVVSTQYSVAGGEVEEKTALHQTFTAEDQLGTVAVTGVLKGYRQGSVLSLNITANTKRLLPYVGPLQLSVLRRDGDIVKSVYSQHYMFNETSTTTFALSETGNFNLTFIFENNITRKSADLTVSVAAVGQYSYVRLVFSKTDTHLAHKWFYQLQQAVLSATIQLLEISPWQVEVNISEAIKAIPLTRQPSDVLLVANVYLIPFDLTTNSVSNIKQHANQLLKAANDHTLSFTVNGQTLLVDSADLGTPTLPQFNYLPVVIGGSIGAGILFVLIVIAVVILAVYWKKKYRSLEVRYTRLQQGPVRFTFTAEGEMLDEDDTGANEDDKDEEMASFTSFPQPGTIGENESDS